MSIGNNNVEKQRIFLSTFSRLRTRRAFRDFDEFEKLIIRNRSFLSYLFYLFVYSVIADVLCIHNSIPTAVRSSHYFIQHLSFEVLLPFRASVVKSIRMHVSKLAHMRMYFRTFSSLIQTCQTKFFTANEG
jgi:hypothetical protein